MNEVGEIFQEAPGPKYLFPRQLKRRTVPEAPLPLADSSRRRQAQRLSDAQKAFLTLSWKAKELVRERAQIQLAFEAAGKPTAAMKKELRAHLHRNSCCMRALGYDHTVVFDPKHVIKLYGAKGSIKRATIRSDAKRVGRVESVTHDSKDQAEMALIRRALRAGK